ncbi:hypothetical protein SAMN05216374_2672 [Tardiphaga sp. OK246]|jgi:hypothetical protein|uniref:hypothetical protein n=1 Tax=Tardiphaga sp. OK246 TaxID=1855307 RepID=UPI000B652915|nr:hypothetical protein [Tardiphaga sp. OK246]SNT09844.1 hypothetical protein SAMN05216374_2672 [Tardiphaga sp. OK246]
MEKQSKDQPSRGRPSWINLRSIGNSGPARAAILVPVIGYLIILNSTLVEYLRLHGIEPTGSLTISDRLWDSKIYLLYFGLTFFGIGSAIYQWKCPHFVKKYADWTEYVAGTRPHIETGNIGTWAKLVGADLNTDRTRAFSRSDDELLKRYLQTNFLNMSFAHPFWRAVVASCFVIGFALLTIPSAMTAARVAGALISSMTR